MSVNKWIGIGNTCKDVELKYTASGTAVASFSIACNEKYKDKSGQYQEKCEFINIVSWSKLAEICGEYLKKGQQVYIEGRIQTRGYDDRDGNKRYVTEIVADKMQMLGVKHGGGDSRRQDSGQNNEPTFNPEDDIPF